MQVQTVMMQQGKGWSPEVLALPNCGPQVTEEGLLIWYGPRIRMGMCEGTPTSIMPHQTSGRADYFGPLVNRLVFFHKLVNICIPDTHNTLTLQHSSSGQAAPQCIPAADFVKLIHNCMPCTIVDTSRWALSDAHAMHAKVHTYMALQ